MTSRLCSGLCLVLAATLPLRSQTRSRAGLEDLIRQAEALRVRTGVIAAQADGAVLFHHCADEPFVPASNQKLLTVAAALVRLGPDYEFATRFQLREGWLEVVAAGDPNWQTGTEHDPARIFAAVAQALRERGVARIRGVRLLDAPFGPELRPATWERYPEEVSYCAPTAGLVLDAGLVVTRLVPRGGEVRIEVIAPPVHLPITGAIDLTDSRPKGSVYGVRDLGGRLQAFGHMWTKAGARMVQVAAKDPELLFRLALEEALRGAGIELDAAAAPRDAELLEHRSSLAQALGPTLRDSSNFHAEQLLRVLGARARGDGSFAGGLEALRAAIVELAGTWPQAAVAADGSGLSRENRTTPRFLAQVLQAALTHAGGTLLLANLAQGGVDGTLEKRFVDSPLAGRVLAKTGTIRGVSALSGAVRLRSGRLRLFTILMNWDKEQPGLLRELRALQDHMVEAIADLDAAR